MTAALSLAVTAPPRRHCLVCGGRDFAPMFAGTPPARRARPAAYHITHSSRFLVAAIERCRSCGLGILPPELIEVRHYMKAADDRFVQQAEPRCRNAERLLDFLPPPAPGSRLLDLGSAYGFLLVAARKRGYDVAGVEPSQPAAEHARRAYGVEVFNGTLDQAPFESGSFGVVTLSDVIEHLSDPVAVVRHLRRLIRPSGYLVILTPDMDSLVARIMGRHWWALLDDHYFYFSRRTLARFLEQHGFLIERLESFGRTFPIGHWVFKLSQYSQALYKVSDRLLRLAGLADVELPLNLGDQMVCVARRRSDECTGGELRRTDGGADGPFGGPPGPPLTNDQEVRDGNGSD